MGDPRRPKVDQEEPRGIAPSSFTLHWANAELSGGRDLLKGSQRGSRMRVAQSCCLLHTAEPYISYLVPSFPNVTLPPYPPQSLSASCCEQHQGRGHTVTM